MSNTAPPLRPRWLPDPPPQGAPTSPYDAPARPFPTEPRPLRTPSSAPGSDLPQGAPRPGPLPRPPAVRDPRER